MMKKDMIMDVELNEAELETVAGGTRIEPIIVRRVKDIPDNRPILINRPTFPIIPDIYRERPIEIDIVEALRLQEVLKK